MPSVTSSSTLSEKSWWLASCMTMKHLRLRARFPKRASFKVTVPSHRLRPHTASANVDLPAPHEPTNAVTLSTGSSRLEISRILSRAPFFRQRTVRLSKRTVSFSGAAFCVPGFAGAPQRPLFWKMSSMPRARSPSRMRSASSRRANSPAVHRRAMRPLSR